MKKQNQVREEAQEEDQAPVLEEDIHDSCEKRLEEITNQYRRILADYQNLEKRVREEKSDWIKSANLSLLQRLLPTLDMLEMTAKHNTDKTLELVITVYKDALKGEGVEKIETVGKVFDPSLMEAVEIIDGNANIVIEERRPGYLLYGKLLRPAEVAVGGK